MKEMIHGGDIYRHPDITDFSSNCNPFGPPQCVQDAICRAAGQIGHYPDVQCSRLRKALAEKLNIPQSWIFFGNGAAEVIFAAVQAWKPKQAVLPAPTFAEYAQALETVGCKIQYVETAEADGFAIPQTIADALTDETDMLFLCNPNNPTGTLLPKEKLKKILHRAHECGTMVVIDECFLDFVDNADGYSMLSELAEHPHVLLLKAFTKLYAIAGVRLGYGISSNTDMIEKLECSVQPWNVSMLAQAAGTAALSAETYVRDSLAVIREEKKYLTEHMKQLGLTVYASEANYIFFRGPEDLGKQLLAEGFLVRDCSNYRGLTNGYYRIAVRLRPDNERLIRTLEKLLD